MTRRKRVKLSKGRRLVCDIVRLARKVPSYGLICDLDVAPLLELRKRIRPRLSWTVIMMKAYARVAARTPELRQHYVGFPWPHIHEHNRNVAMMVVSRQYGGEERLFFARFTSPEQHSLLELQERHDHFRTAPVAGIKHFRHQLGFARAPWFLRRLGWWIMIHVWAGRAPLYMGTFGVSVARFKDVRGTHHLSPLTSTLGVDVVSRGGIAHTVLTFDHRIFDAGPAARIFAELARELHGPVREEMRQIAAEQTARPSATARAAVEQLHPA